MPTPEAPDAGGPLTGHAWGPTGARIIHTLDDVAATLEDPASRIWLDVEDASEEMLGHLAQTLELHHLVAEDIIERNQRAKLVIWEEGLHLVLFAMRFDDEVSIAEVDIVLGRRFLLTSHPPTWRPIERLDLGARSVGHLLEQGTDMLLYAVIDPIVDGYFPVIDRISDEIEGLEDDVARRSDGSIVDRLFRVRRSLLEVRHAVSPEREILNQLSNRDIPFIDASRRLYFRDVYDHTIRIMESVDTTRDLLAGVLETYLSQASNRMNRVMKQLSIVSTIALPLIVVGGIYGMNFSRLPFADHPLGFYLALASMGVISAGILWWLKRQRWV